MTNVTPTPMAMGSARQRIAETTETRLDVIAERRTILLAELRALTAERADLENARDAAGLGGFAPMGVQP